MGTFLMCFQGDTFNVVQQPHHVDAPLWRDRPKALHERKRNQQGNDEPAIVKADRDACDSAELDLCLHSRTSNYGIPRLRSFVDFD